MQRHPSKKKSSSISSYLLFYVLITAVSFGVYFNALQDGFVFDDESVVLGDQSITQISNIPKYFTAQEGFHKVIGRYYRPVVSTTYAVDYALWGLKPFGFHLTNIIIHVINSLLFFRLLLLIFSGEKLRIDEGRLYAVLFGGLVFAVHPVHTEAVTWISGRTDSLSFTFFTASFIYYIHYIRNSKKSYLFFLLFFYVLALLSKEMAITLPAVVLLYDIAENKGLKIELLKKRIGLYSALIVVSAAYLFLRGLILKDIPERETYFYFYGKDALTSFLTMLQTLPHYFWLTVVPANLLYHYNGYLPYVSSFGSAGVIIALAFLLVMAAIAAYMFRRVPLIAFSVFFFFVTLLPVMNIVPTMNFMAERFLYIPSVSLSLVIAVIFCRYYSAKTKSVLISILVLVLVLYSYQTYMRNYDWKDNNTLFLTADGVPGTVTYVNIGNIYANNQEFDKAEVYYRKAIDLKNETLLANVNLGKIFIVRGNYDSAYYYLYKSYKLDTLSPEPMHALAQLYANSNRLPEAIQWLEKIQKLTPNYMNSLEMLNNLKKRITSGEQAPNVDSDKALRISTLESDSYKSYQQKNYDKAIRELLQLVELNPQGRAGYFNNIGISYLDQNKFNEAKEYFEKSVQEKKDFSTAYNNLGSVYEKMGNKTKARENYIKAIEFDSTNQTAKDNLNKLK